MSSDSERDLTGSDDSEPDIEIELRVDPSDEIGSSSRGQKKKKKNKYRTCIGRQTIVNLVVNLLEEAMASQPTEPPSVFRCHTWKAARTRRDSNDPKKVVPVNEDEMDKMPDTGDLGSDPIARRFGPEYPGGVTPSTVNLTIHNERRYMQLSHDCRISLAEREELRRRMSSMEREMAEIKELVRDCTCSTPRDQRHRRGLESRARRDLRRSHDMLSCYRISPSFMDGDAYYCITILPTRSSWLRPRF